MMGKTEGKRKRGQQKMRWLDGITDSIDVSLSKLREIAKDREDSYATIPEVTKSQTQLSNWTTTKMYMITIDCCEDWMNDTCKVLSTTGTQEVLSKIS